MYMDIAYSKLYTGYNYTKEDTSMALLWHNTGYVYMSLDQIFYVAFILPLKDQNYYRKTEDCPIIIDLTIPKPQTNRNNRLQNYITYETILYNTKHYNGTPLCCHLVDLVKYDLLTARFSLKILPLYTYIYISIYTIYI